jgi:mono/diheme cytochrome c family protein
MRRALTLLLAGAAVSGCLDEDLINPMAARQDKVLAYSESEFYSDGLGMREPPQGTVPRERIVLNPALSTGRIAGARESNVCQCPGQPPGDVGCYGNQDCGTTNGCQGSARDGICVASPANYVTTFPLKVDRPLVALGKKRFDITCATCHGPVGDGDSIVAHQMSLRPPPSLHNYIDRPPGYIYEVITHGFGLMASYAGELPVRERWAVVAYIRALQLSQATPLAKAPPEAQSKLPPPGAPDEPPMPAPATHAPHQEAP